MNRPMKVFDDPRNGNLERLRQDYQAHRLPVVPATSEIRGPTYCPAGNTLRAPPRMTSAI